jgi:hypothetical protein
MKVFLAILILLWTCAILLAPGSALAQTKVAAPRLPLTGDVGADIEAAKVRQQAQAGGIQTRSSLSTDNPLAKPLQDLATFISSDATAAIALSTAIPELQDPNGGACWVGFEIAAKVFTAHPVPLTLHAMTDVEALRLLIMASNKLCANAACTVVFADLANVAQTASPVPLPIPSLQQLCSRIAQISPPIPGLPAIVAPVDIVPPVAPAPKP